MPRGDGTGPRGTGAMSGRGAGYCAGFGMPGYANPLPGRGFGVGFGGRCGGGRGGVGFGSGGRGWRNRFYATGQPAWARACSNAAPELEKQAMKDRARALESELDFIKKRLNEIEAETDA